MKRNLIEEILSPLGAVLDNLKDPDDIAHLKLAINKRSELICLIFSVTCLSLTIHTMTIPPSWQALMMIMTMSGSVRMMKTG